MDRVGVDAPCPLSAREGANGRPGEISLCTCTGTCTDILPLACTTDSSTCSGARPAIGAAGAEGAAPSGYARRPDRALAAARAPDQALHAHAVRAQFGVAPEALFVGRRLVQG